MDFDWTSDSYREVVNRCLGYREKRRPRGVIKSLADALRCHPTFIAQVLKERADFSPEQGYEICQHFSFSNEQREFFLTLLMRDRAGTAALKEHYHKKLIHILEVRRDLRPDSPLNVRQSGSFELEYFGNWIYQTVHALTQIQRFQTVTEIAKALALSTVEVKAILDRLEAMGLVKKDKSAWKSTLNSLHLAKDSHCIRYLHSTWKTKLLADLQRRSTMEGTRYSGLITVTEKDYHKVRDVLVNAIKDIRKIVEASSSEGAYVLSLDCYEI
jgi:uncharacterized protein (TIGR02147 family)